MGSLSGRRVGFIGLGLMGAPMVRNLMKAGAEVIGFNRSAEKMHALMGEGMLAAASAVDVAEQTSDIIVMLTDTPAVEHVAGDLASVVGPDHLIIDMGTTAVSATRAIAAEICCDWLDAPVSGGTVGAEAGSLTIMAGGSEASLERARPVLEALGSRITHVGDVGTGQIAKAANQMIVGLTIGAVSEALALAKKAGADPAKVREALKGGFADSRILELHGNRMVTGDFTPGGKCTTQRKDMKQALDLAMEIGLELPATRLNHDLYDELIAQGDGDLDHAALYRLYEK